MGAAGRRMMPAMADPAHPRRPLRSSSSSDAAGGGGGSGARHGQTHHARHARRTRFTRAPAPIARGMGADARRRRAALHGSRGLSRLLEAPSSPRSSTQYLPDTDTLGARAAGVHVFVDLAVAECLPAGERTAFGTGLDELNAACRQHARRRPRRAAPAAVATLLREAEAAGTPFVKALKGLTVLGYGTSRIGATQALADDRRPAATAAASTSRLASAPGRAMTTRAQASQPTTRSWSAPASAAAGRPRSYRARTPHAGARGGPPVVPERTTRSRMLRLGAAFRGQPATGRRSTGTQRIQTEAYLRGLEALLRQGPRESLQRRDKPFQWIRGRHVGGRSLMWGRQVYRWSDLDFEANAREGIAVDWPIRYADIAPWYDHVERFIGVSGQAEGCRTCPTGSSCRHGAELRRAGDCGRRLPQMRRADPDDRPLRHPHPAPQRPRRVPLLRTAAGGAASPSSYFSSIGSTLPAAERTGRLTLRPNSVVQSVLYDERRDRATGVRVIERRHAPGARVPRPGRLPLRLGAGEHPDPAQLQEPALPTGLGQLQRRAGTQPDGPRLRRRAPRARSGHARR